MKKSVEQSHSIGTAPRLLTIQRSLTASRSVSAACGRGASAAKGRRRFESVLPYVGTNAMSTPG